MILVKVEEEKEEWDGVHGEAAKGLYEDIGDGGIPVVHGLYWIMRNGLLLDIVDADSVEI